MTKGKFITFEGGEGCGKTTQVTILVNKLTEKGIKVLRTREPGGTPGAEAIRKLLVEGEPDRWLPMSEALLFLAARYDHLVRAIRPALAEGTWVVSDRYIDSSYMYQGAVRGLGIPFVERLHVQVLGEFEPDLTYVLDIPAQIGLKRASERVEAKSRFEKFDITFHESLNANYRQWARWHDRCKIINADKNIDDVALDIWTTLFRRSFL